ncbi:MAG: hypothetical protein IAB19_10100, partial [Proteobacteria bacterium]|nr:hypothetical protein [Candidatus Avisuccinivibrio stercorigallinarum]
YRWFLDKFADAMKKDNGDTDLQELVKTTYTSPDDKNRPDDEFLYLFGSPAEAAASDELCALGLRFAEFYHTYGASNTEPLE